MNIFEELEKLVQYGLNKKLIEEWDVDYVRNELLSILNLNEWKKVETNIKYDLTPEEVLSPILDWAFQNGILKHDSVTFRDLLDTKLMGTLVARPSTIIKKFNHLYNGQGPKAATNYFYELAQDSHYIRMNRVRKNEHWYSPTEYGDLEITINLSKPEKDPLAIAAEKGKKSISYPECLLCKENVGYKGRVDHPARQNHRIIPIELDGKQWFLQYSPYVYYNEHAIIFSSQHEPMKISKSGFNRLLAFVEQYPHYFIGSNADLPIVGGSILSHDHFQGGHHTFPMAKAGVEWNFTCKGFEEIEAGIVRWPMSVIRLRGKNRFELARLADHVLNFWKSYSDPEVEIFAETKNDPHNTITPIARFKEEKYELDLVLRNNRTSKEHPLGIFHPHQEVHHIKKENIGLIEVMGLAVLPGRLKEELTLVAEYLLKPDFKASLLADERTSKHTEWACKLMELNPKVDERIIQKVVRDGIGKVFSLVLEHAGVFKRTEEGKTAFKKFIQKFSESL